MNSELLWIIKALAQPYALQISLFPDFVVVADELALEWERVFVLRDSIECKGIAYLNEIDKKILLISGKKNAKLWTNESLEKDKIWDEIRNLARSALKYMEFDYSPPSLSSSIYISSEN